MAQGAFDVDVRRPHNFMTPVEDQGNSNVCWVYTSCGLLESLMNKKYGRCIRLSRQHLIDVFDSSRQFEGGIYGSDRLENVLEFVRDEGVFYESDYLNSEIQPQRRLYPLARFQEQCHSNEAITTCLDNGIPLLTIVGVGSDFTGPMWQGNWTIYEPNQFTINHKVSRPVCHMMVTVGYGCDKHGVEYWKEKNCYGTGWGKQGYCRIRRHDRIVPLHHVFELEIRDARNLDDLQYRPQ